MPHNLHLFPVFFISVEPANSTGRILCRLHSFEVKIRPNCLGRSCYIHLSTHRTARETVNLLMNRHVSMRIVLTLQSPSNHLSPLVSFRSLPLHHSSFMMPARGLLQWTMARKTLINYQLTRFELVCSLIEQATAKFCRQEENLSPRGY